MNHAPRAPASPRAVDRALGELRRGVAVAVLGDAGERILALPAETATLATLEEFLAEAELDVQPVLVLAPSRVADIVPGLLAGHDVFDDLASLALPLDCAKITVATLRSLADPTSQPVPHWQSASRPGPAPFPGNLARAGLQLAKLARLLPAVLMASQARNRDGFAGLRGSSLLEVAAADILTYPHDTSEGLVRAAEARLPLAESGDARIVAFRPPDGGIEHLAVLIGRPEDAASPLVRVHSECFTGDLLGSQRCDCGPQLHQAIGRMAAEGAGVLLYMAQEGRGIGLVNKLRAYALQDGVGGRPGLDTLDANRALGYGADERSFAAAATMLRRLGILRVRLLTNNPAKLAGLTVHGIEVTGRVAHAIPANGVNDGYLETKARRFGHLLG